MTTVILVLAVWLALNAAYVALKVRQSRLVYPTPPRVVPQRAIRIHAA